MLYDRVTAAAAAVNGTETAVFTVSESSKILSEVLHIRPGATDDKMRAAAMAAFHDLVQTCVTHRKDGVIEVSSTVHETRPQFCLIKLIRQGEQITAAIAIITRCRNQSEAQTRLATIGDFL